MSKESPGQRAVRESGHKDVSHAAHSHIHHNHHEPSPIPMPPREAPGSSHPDITKVDEAGKSYNVTKAASEREWNGPAGSTK